MFSGRLQILALVLSTAAFTQAQDRSLLNGNSQVQSLRDQERVSLSEEQYGELPLTFEPNEGQAGVDVRFVARTRGTSVLLQDRGATLVTTGRREDGSEQQTVLRMSLAGGKWAQSPVAREQQEGTTNYLVGNDPTNWHAGIANFGRVLYAGVYPGVDLVFYGNHRRLEHDFQVAMGADYRQIRVRLDGAKSLSATTEGALEVRTEGAMLRFEPPTVYQPKGRERITVEGRYLILGENEFGFELGTYDKGLPIVIDPVLSYSTYLAGSGSDFGAAIAVDQNGSAYITGYTNSTDFPAKGTASGTCGGNCSVSNVFVTKLNAQGTALVYSTIVGGSGSDQATAIAIDAYGNAVVTGTTSSVDFPQKNGITVVISTYSSHGFVFSLTTSGAGFHYATYLGGDGQDVGTGVALDSAGNAYVAGITSSTNFPVTAGHQIGTPPANYSGNDIFVVKLAKLGHLQYATLIGGNGSGNPYPNYYPSYSVISLGVDLKGEATVGGAAYSGLITTAGAYQSSWPNTVSASSGFVQKLDATGATVLYGSYLGGTGANASNGQDYISQIVVDSLGYTYATGTAGSLDFPTTPGAYQTANAGTQPVAFVTKMDPSLSTLEFSTLLGGSKSSLWQGGSNGMALALDSNNDVMVAGSTTQTDFPLVSPLVAELPFLQQYSTATAFLSVLNPTGSGLTYSTLFGGSTGAAAGGVATDLSGDAYITGTTQDTDLPTTPGAFQSKLSTTGYQQHAFATKFSLSQPNASACFSTNVLYFSSIDGAVSYPETLAITNCGTLSLTISSVVNSNPAFTGDFTNCKTIAATKTCNLTMRYAPLAGSSYDSGTLTFQDNAPLASQIVELSGNVLRPDINVYPYYQLGFGDVPVGVTGISVTYQITTTQGLPLHITAVQTTGPFAASTNCPTALPVDHYCTLSVTFTPTAVGAASGTVLVYDDAPNSPQSMTLSGNGLASYPTPVLQYIYPGAIAVGSPGLKVEVQGTGLYPATTLLINGKPYTGTVHAYYYGLLFTLPAGSFSKMRTISIQAVNPAPGGISAPATLTVYRRTTLGAADVIYEPFTQQFYATMPASSANNPNTLLTIDPNTGIIGTPIAIGNDPAALSVSDDGTQLYVGLNGDHAVVPFDVASQTAGNEVVLPTDPQSGAQDALDIQTQPGVPGNAVVTLGIPSTYYTSYGGLTLLSGGRFISTFFDEPPNNTSVGGTRFFGNTSVYGWSNSYQSTGMLHFEVSNNQLLEAAGFGSGYNLGPYATDGTNLFDTNGQVFSPTGILMATLNLDSYVQGALYDASSRRILYAGDGIFAVDPTSFTSLGFTAAPEASNSRLMKWGPDGLAYLVQNQNGGYDIVQVRSNFFYSSSGTNAVPTLSSVSPSTVSAKGRNFVLTVSGSGFVSGAVAQWNGHNRTAVVVNSSTLTVDIPFSDIASAGTATVTVTNPAPGGGKSNTGSVVIQ